MRWLIAFSKKERYEKSFNEEIGADKCEVVDIWELLGRRWSLSILKNLSTEDIRSNELKRILPGISSTVLSERLFDFEREGLVTKKIYPEIPPKVEYRLTPQAKELQYVFNGLAK
ncbi:MAG: winged helix-turn-helix transcriptional regulator [Nitrososphaeraceae archaeon]